MPAPSVSIIMPCYNHAHFVAESMKGILGQTFKDFELIVVDDCSQDESVGVLRKLDEEDSRLRLIVHNHNLGASRSRNDGLRTARGKFVGFCDADDIWKPHKLERQIKLLMARPDCDVTYCDSEIIDQTGMPTGEFFSRQFPPPSGTSEDLFEVLCTRNFVNMSTVLARRETLGERLLFDENIQWVEDWWLWIHLSRHHRFLYEPDALVQYRVHPKSTGFTQKPGISRNRWKVCKRNLRVHADMPLRLQALVWYQMALELCDLGKGRQGCRFLRQAVWRGWAGGVSFSKLVKMNVRFVLEWRRRTLSQADCGGATPCRLPAKQVVESSQGADISAHSKQVGPSVEELLQ